MSKRIEWIDVAKGILIILVVLGHGSVSMETDLIINSFHMAAFFLLSGITTKFRENIRVFFTKRLKGLIVPYIVLALIFLGYQFMKYKIFGGGYEFNLKSGLLSVFFPVSGRDSTTVYGLWFLPCLFLAEVLVYLLECLHRINRALSILVYIAGSLCCIFLSIETETVSIITIVPVAVLWLICGIYVKNKIKNIYAYRIKMAILAGMLFAVFTGANYYLSNVRFDLSSMTLGIWPLYILSGLSGALFIICVSMQLENKKLLSNIGKDSLLYYGLHYEVLGIVDKIVNIGCIQAVITLGVLWWVIRWYKKLKNYIWKIAKR